MGGVDETIFLGRSFAFRLKKGSIVALFGELGAGKTTFVQGIMQGLGYHGVVNSPTFTYLHIYQAPICTYHFDLYRLKEVKDFITLGFEEYLYEEGICLIEWPEKILSILPPETLQVKLEHKGEEKRTITWDC